ncbi:hypothetical protein D9757_013101 [Collybiopsis confluens]|uniref:Uncharacterized protein n=1 Tax=Collybiopsis confluens TaxID=2823264 RepID=A0A8H5CWU9_9AGAR|nr:hypothetical protein D9757_013101 [Collybiopsis confluens]
MQLYANWKGATWVSFSCSIMANVVALLRLDERRRSDLGSFITVRVRNGIGKLTNITEITSNYGEFRLDNIDDVTEVEDILVDILSSREVAEPEPSYARAI